MKSMNRTCLVVAVALVAFALLPASSQAQGVLYVQDNKVGIGTDTPSVPLHVQSADKSARVLVKAASATAGEATLFALNNKGKTRFSIANEAAGVTWTFDNGGTFTISKVGTGVNEFIVDGAGNLTILGTLTQGSSIHSKENIHPVDPEMILDGVLGLPISRWNYRTDGGGIRHVGPMAQDFYSKFQLGASETGIATIDMEGVALASIQGLHKRLEQRDQRIEELAADNLALEQRVQQLEGLVNQLVGNTSR